MYPVLRAAAAAGLLTALLAAPAPDGPIRTQAEPSRLYPTLTAAADGTILASWLESDAHGAALRFSRWRDGVWGPTSTVATGDDWLVNWADFPQVVELPGGSMAASWLRLRPGRGAYDVRLAWSADGGATWSAPITPHTDGTATEHGFVSLFPLDTGAGVIWLDGRAYAADRTGPMGLRFTRYDGTPPSADGIVVDGRVCDCCQTDAAAVDGGAVVVYRDRSEEEIRDIRLVRLTDGAWSEPVVVHADGWRIDACPVNGPAVAADGQNVAVAWFTAAGDVAAVQLAFSRDGGATFGPPVRIDEGDPMGRVDLLLLSGGHALVSWMERTAAGAEVRLRRVTPEGAAGPARTAGSIEAGRASGFPRMARSGDTVLLGWTVSAEEGGLRFATVALDGS